MVQIGEERGKAMVDASVMTLLQHRVPLTLLCDLLDPGGPHSREIMQVESVGSAAATSDEQTASSAC